MTVPEGFSVDLVASEPEIVNPVAMTFDERGRIWITESLEYPRKTPGQGKDRVKVLEDTDADGRADKFSVFAEGLNIPSGIAVGHGGVWVANSPDILFYKIGKDGKAAGKPEVVVTGFGRTDTHELPNSLTWGPDGWLYGLNGVFNHSHVKHKGKDHVFTCALFRIHPKTRDFEVFCEGTSNPWGIAWDTEGSADGSHTNTKRTTDEPEANEGVGFSNDELSDRNAWRSCADAWATCCSMYLRRARSAGSHSRSVSRSLVAAPMLNSMAPTES